MGANFHAALNGRDFPMVPGLSQCARAFALGGYCRINCDWSGNIWNGPLFGQRPNSTEARFRSYSLPAHSVQIGPLLSNPSRANLKLLYLALNFYAAGEIETRVIRDRLMGAFRKLGDVPGVATAVGAVLSVLHVIRPDGPEYDVSYSDPLLPFSIFVGIDANHEAHFDLRLAESILHECMHLQMTLIEEAMPMVSAGEELYHSPWQGEDAALSKVPSRTVRLPSHPRLLSGAS